MIRTGFSALDNLTGGLAERQGYLVYGNAQEAKSALALAFLASGVENGEEVALVTDRSLESVVEEGRGYGFDLNEAILSGKFQFFGYPEGVAANSMQLLDDARIMEEFQGLTGHNRIRRLVFDPVTPLLNAQHPGASAKRFHAIISAVSRMGATAIYLVDATGNGESVVPVREMAHGVMRLDTAGLGSGKIVFERWPESPSAESLDFGIVAGIGLVSLNRLPAGSPEGDSPGHKGSELRFSPYQLPSTRASAVGSLAPGSLSPASLSSGSLAHGSPLTPQALPAGLSPNLLAAPVPSFDTTSVERVQETPNVLLVHPDSAVRTLLTNGLSSRFNVSEAHGVASGMAILSGQAPDLLVLANEMAGVCGGALAFKLRQSGYNIPIIIVGSRVRRISDKAKFLRAGVDVVLDFPLDVPLLTLYVDNLLRRNGRLDEPLHPEAEAPTPQKRGSANCTLDLDYFCERASEMYTWADVAAATSPVITLRITSGKPMVEELSSAILLTARATDLVYVGSSGVALFLPESGDTNGFLARFRHFWADQAPLRIESPRIVGQSNILMQLHQFVRETTGQGSSKPSGHGMKGKAFGAVVGGHRVESGE